jgi:hypothetical protein
MLKTSTAGVRPMTLMLFALWIAGHEFHWWWLIVSLAIDAVWLSIKLNFLAVLVRRSVEESLPVVEMPPLQPPSGPPAA